MMNNGDEFKKNFRVKARINSHDSINEIYGTNDEYRCYKDF